MDFDLEKMRNELSIKGKNGLGFLLAGTVIWIIISVIFLLNIEIYNKSIFMLFSTGLMFPLAVGISQLIGADWKFKTNPIGSLGLYLNLAQIIYFPILFWAIGKSPEEAVIFFAIITAAHFFPYGWFYNAKPYFIMAPISSLAMIFIGWNAPLDKMWLVPVSLVIFLLILIFWLYIDYRKKSNK